MIGGVTTIDPVPVASDVAAWLAGGAAWLSLRGLVVVGTAAAAIPLAAMPVDGAAWLTAAWYPGLALVVRRLKRRAESGPPVLEPIGAPRAYRQLSPKRPRSHPPSPGPPGRDGWPSGRPRGLLATAVTGPDGRLHLTVLDIGQGDTILIEAPDGATALVDGGADPDLTLRRMGEALPFHHRRIDVVVLTHPHQDHLGGLEEVFRRYEVGLFVDGARPAETEPHRALLAAAAGEPGARVVAARAGELIRVGKVTLEVLFPDALDVAAPLAEGDVNNGSIVLLVRYGAFKALLTGDAEAPVEALLEAREMPGPVDVLKVGHHGSYSGTTPDFVAATRPAVAVVSAGVDNSYGHPHRSTLDALAQVPGVVYSHRPRRQCRSRDRWGLVLGRRQPRRGRPAAGAIGSAGERNGPAGPRRRRLPDRPSGRRLRRSCRRDRNRGAHPGANAGTNRSSNGRGSRPRRWDCSEPIAWSSASRCGPPERRARRRDRLVGIVEALPDGAALALAELRPSRDVGRPPAFSAGSKRRCGAPVATS